MIRISCPQPGWVPVLALARSSGLRELARHHLTVPSDKGANAGLKVTSLVAGMVAGADSIDDMALLRHGGMGRVFTNAYAPSTLGSFLRSFTFGHVRQLDAVASRFLVRLAEQAPLIAAAADESSQQVMVDIDDTIIVVHGYAKQGLGLRLLRSARPQRDARHGEYQGHRAGRRGPTPAQRFVRFPTRRETVGR